MMGSGAAMLLGVLQTASAASFDNSTGIVSLNKVDVSNSGSYRVIMRYVPPLVVLQSADPITSAASADASFNATTGSLLIPSLSVGNAKYKLSLQQIAGSFNFTISGVDSASAYPIVDTGQTACSNATSPISCPQTGSSFYGQDAQHAGSQPSYTNNGDGTISDNVTGLMWQQTPDSNGDGRINAADKLSYAAAQTYCENLTLSGYNDWLLPDINQLYSLINFNGKDPSGVTSTQTSGLTPFIDTTYFKFGYGDTGAGERIIDAQYASSTRYVSTTMNGDATLFGVNFADGRIKGYGLTMPGSGAAKTFYTVCVRGNSRYGQNSFVANHEGTITDHATGLMWAQNDSGTGMNWERALAWVAQKNTENYLGHDDWRLPNAKELQSLVDYTRSPTTTSSAAIDPLFNVTAITNEAGQSDYPSYWSGTTHVTSNGMTANAVYIAFGRAMGYMNGTWLDVHGAGAQRSDPKSGSASDYPTGKGPQGDAIRINNYVRLVRG
jgi:hypothetical protein